MVDDPDAVVSPGGDFNAPVPTAKGGPDYGRFVDAVRDVQDHARAADPPAEVISRAADLLNQVSALLAPTTPTSGIRRPAGATTCRCAATC